MAAFESEYTVLLVAGLHMLDTIELIFTIDPTDKYRRPLPTAASIGGTIGKSFVLSFSWEMKNWKNLNHIIDLYTQKYE